MRRHFLMCVAIACVLLPRLAAAQGLTGALIGTVKDAQTQLRHSNATTTMNVYTQEIPASVNATVEALDQNFLGF